MIALTRVTGETVYVNPDLVLYVEETPDTLITFRDGQRLIARESAREVARRILHHARRVRGLAPGEGGER